MHVESFINQKIVNIQKPNMLGLGCHRQQKFEPKFMTVTRDIDATASPNIGCSPA